MKILGNIMDSESIKGSMSHLYNCGLQYTHTKIKGRIKLY